MTASPSVEGSERSLFNVDLNPYISPIITNNIGMGRNAGNSPPDNPTQARSACKKNSGWGPADQENDRVRTVVCRTWGRDTKDKDTGPCVDANRLSTAGDPTTWGVKSVYCTGLSARRTDSSGTDRHDTNTDNCDRRQDAQADNRGTCIHGQGAAKHDIVDDEGHEDRQLSHVNTADKIAKQTTAGTLLFSPDKRDSSQNAPSAGSYRAEGQRLGDTTSQRSHVNDGYINLDREIQIRNAIERVAYELNYLQDELSSVSSHETVGDQSDDTLSAHSTPVYGSVGATDDVIKSVTQNSDPPGTVASNAHTAGRKPFVITPSIGQRDWSSTSSDDSSFSPQRRARSLGARPTQPLLPAGDPPAVYRVHDQAQRTPTRHNDRVDVATSPINLSPSESRYFTVHKCQTGLLSESGFPSNSVALVSQTVPIVDTPRGPSSGATRYEATGSWVRDVNSRRSDEPFNGHVRDATSQGHSDTWVNDDVSTSNAHEVNEVRGQAGQGRQANDKSSKPSANKKSGNSDSETQSKATGGNSKSRDRDDSRRVSRKSNDSDPDSSDDGGDDDKPSKGRGRGKTSPDPGGKTSANKTCQPRRGTHFIKPERFNGEECYESFVMKFEVAAENNGWNDEDKKHWLIWSVTGAASTVMWGGGDRLSYQELLDKLKARYSYSGLEHSYKNELYCRRRRKNETLRSLAQDINRLMALAFPGYPGQRSSITDYLAKEAFIRALDADLAFQVLTGDPQNLDDACRRAQRIEVSRQGVLAIAEARDRPYASRKTRDVSVAESVSGWETSYEPTDGQIRVGIGPDRDASTTDAPPVDAPPKNEVKTQKQALGRRRPRKHLRAVSEIQTGACGQPNVLKEQEQKLKQQQAEIDELKKALERQTAVSSQNQSSMGAPYGDYPVPTQGYSALRGVSGYNPRTYFSSGQGGGDRPVPPRVCWRCGEPGHVQYQCTNLPPPYPGNSVPTGRGGGVYQNANLSSRFAAGSGAVGAKRAKPPAYVRARINGRELPCLLDTGSDVSVLPSFVVDVGKIRSATRGLMVADGSTIPILGTTVASFTTDSYKSRFKALVSEHVHEVMLGIDFLTQNKASWDFAGFKVSFRGRPHSLVDDPSPRQWVRRVKVVSDVQVPARTQMNLSCQVELKTVSDVFKDTGCWGTSPAVLGPSLYLAGTLLPADRYLDVPVRVMNVGMEPRTVKAGTVVGELESFVVGSPPASAVGPRSHSNPAYPPTFGRYVPPRVRATAPEPDLVEELVGHVDDAAPESAVSGLRDLLTQYQDVFSKSEYDLGCTSVVTHRIETENARPVRQQLRRYPPAHLEAISKHVDNLLQQKVIEPATSPWASNIVLVRKKDNSYRCCIDYRGLNNVTVKDRYPLPRVDSCLEAMTGACWFSSIDLRASYHQVSIWPPDRDKTSFICQRGLYRYRMMPFGLCNAGATFQRLMDIVLAGLHMDVCLVYLDDIVVFSKTPAEHLERLNAVLRRLRSAGLKIKPEKCAFFRKSIVFLGHVLSADGISTDPEKIRAVVTWPTPTSVTEVRSFVGLCSY